MERIRSLFALFFGGWGDDAADFFLFFFFLFFLLSLSSQRPIDFFEELRVRTSADLFRRPFSFPSSTDSLRMIRK